MKYRIKFKHVIEEFYEACVEADSEKEAQELFDEDPFGYVTDPEPMDTQGLEIIIDEIEEAD